MNDKINFDDLFDLGKYDYDPKESKFDLDDILGVSVPEIEPDIVPSASKVKEEEAAEKLDETVVFTAIKSNEDRKHSEPKERMTEKKQQHSQSVDADPIVISADENVDIQRAERKERVKANPTIVKPPVFEPLVIETDVPKKGVPVYKQPENAPDILLDIDFEVKEERLPLERSVGDVLIADDNDSPETNLIMDTPVVVAPIEEEPVVPASVHEPIVSKSKSTPVVKSAPQKPKEEFHFNVAAFDEVKAKSKNAAETKQNFFDFVNDGATEDVPAAVSEEVSAEDETKVIAEQTAEPESSAKTEDPMPTSQETVAETHIKKLHVIEEYSSIEERDDIMRGLNSLLRKITAKIVLMGLLLLGNVYLFLGLFERFSFLLPSQINPFSQTANYCFVSLAVAVVYILLNISPLIDGIKKIFRCRLNGDGVSFVLAIASIIYNVYFWLNPEKFSAYSINFDFFLGLSLLMNLLGKRLLVKNISKNFDMISTDDLKTAISRPKSSAVDNDVMVETGCGGDVLYAAYTKNVANYLNRGFSEQNMSDKTDIFTFVVFAIIAFFGLTCWLFRLIELSLLVVLIMALICISSTVFLSWSHLLFVYKLGVFLRKNGTMISGRDGAVAMSESGVLVVHDTDLLDCDDIGLCGMQVKSGYDVTEILLSLSSLFEKVGGPLQGFFAKILDDRNDFEFPAVYEPYYYEQLGYTFSANGSRMAVGNAEFMRQLRIEVPESKAGNDVCMIYVTVDNELAGIFGVTYKISSKTARSLSLLEGEGLSVAIISTDFNLCEDMFSSAVNDPEMITLLSGETARACKNCCGELSHNAADVVTFDRIFGMAAGLAGGSMLLSSCVKQMAYRVAATIFGIAAILVVTFVGNADLSLLPLQILLYQVLWNLPNFFRSLRIKI